MAGGVRGGKAGTFLFIVHGQKTDITFRQDFTPLREPGGKVRTTLQRILTPYHLTYVIVRKKRGFVHQEGHHPALRL